jgi:predicted SAM-dependent methyltransferase
LTEPNRRVLALDIGCGEEKRGDAIGLDIRRTDSTDVMADASLLPFKDGAFDNVFSSHLVEHFSHRDISKIISEWVRVLKNNGTMEIWCPDLRARALMFFLRPTLQNMRNLYGEQDYHDNVHRSGFSYGILKRELESSGVRNVRRIIDGYAGIPFLPNCLHVRGTKR